MPIRLTEAERRRRSEAATARNTTHGKSKTPEYLTWIRINSRCHNPKDKDYPGYGGNGITVCEEWRQSFEAFYEYMGDRPSAGHSIDRIKNELGYQPGNVRWATKTQQNQNRNYGRKYPYRGEMLCVAEIARRSGVSHAMLGVRLGKGMDVEQAITTPPQRGRKLL